MRRLLPVLLAAFGLLAGAGAGFLLRPVPPDTAGDAAGDVAAAEPPERAAPPPGQVGEGSLPVPEYVKLNNQFVVPDVENGEVAALVILSISLEVAPGTTEAVYAREPRLRDGFLRVLFDHANAGGFRGAFTRSGNMEALRGALLEVARASMGPAIADVLIIDIVRQDS